MRAVLLAILMLLPALAGCLGDLVPGSARVKPTDYLSDDTYTTWVIEVDYVEGFKPSNTALNLLKTRMEGLANKDNIDIVVDDVMPANGRNWNINSLLAAKAEYQDFTTSGSRVVTWVGYLDGQWPSDSGGTVLGVALSDHETVGIMAEDIATSGFLLISSTDVEKTVLVHELGHIVGLVDNGIPMQTNHEDPDADGHSSNSGSVMTASVETVSGFNQLAGAPPTTFDSNDKADVCAAGGKC